MEKRLDLIEQGFVIARIQEELKKSFELEALKGCDSKIYANPVDIEPPFQSYHLSDFLRQNRNYNIPFVPKVISIQKDRAFLRLWFSTSDQFDWQNFDIIFKELSIIRSQISFLLIGNCKKITCELGVNREDVMPLHHTLTSKFPNIQIDSDSDSCFFHFVQKSKSYTFDIRDFIASAPYWHNVVNHEALKNSCTPLLPIYSTLSSLPEEEVGFYQIIFKGTRYPWRANILNLIESEFESSRYGSIRQGLFPSSGLGIEDFKEAGDFKEAFDVVTARALGSIELTTKYSLPLLKPEGVFITIKSSNQKDEFADSRRAAAPAVIDVTEAVGDNYMVCVKKITN